MSSAKFIQLLGKKPPATKTTAVQTLIPGAKSRGDCASECLILRNCQNLNKRLLTLLFQYREVLSRLLTWAYAPPRRNNRGNYDYENGYAQCCEDIHRASSQLLSKEDQNILVMQTLMTESYAYFSEMEKRQKGDPTMARRARELRIRYDRMYQQIQGIEE